MPRSWQQSITVMILPPFFAQAHTKELAAKRYCDDSALFRRAGPYQGAGTKHYCDDSAFFLRASPYQGAGSKVLL